MTTVESSTQPALPSSSSTHRLPTFSASQALQSLKANDTHTTISTSLPQLDALLEGGSAIDSDLISHNVGNDTENLDNDNDNDGNADHRSNENHGERERSGRCNYGGIRRGQLTEIYGPPGVGKTAFCMQLAVNAIRAGNEVIWVDCSSPIVSSRLVQIYRSGLDENLNSANIKDERKRKNEDKRSCKSIPSWKDRFHHLMAPTLAHLLALFLHPPQSISKSSSSTFPPPKSALLVIDSISTVFDDVYRQDRGRGKQQQQYHQVPQHSYASSSCNRSANSLNITNKQTSAHSQPRHLVLSDLINRLSSFAALNNVAVIYTSQTATRLVRYGSVNAGSAAGIAGTGTTTALSTSSVSLATVPTLCPVLGGGNNSNADWHASVAVRIVLFKDWIDGYMNSSKANDDNDDNGHDENLMISSMSQSAGSDRQQEQKQEQVKPTEETEVNVQGQGQGHSQDNLSRQETVSPFDRNGGDEEIAQTKCAETIDTTDNRPDNVKRESRRDMEIRINDARFAALLKVRYIPLAEDAALRRAVCFDIEKDGGLVPVFRSARAVANKSASSEVPKSIPNISTTNKTEIPPTITTAATHTTHGFTPASSSAPSGEVVAANPTITTATKKPNTTTTTTTTTTLLPKRPYAEIADSDDDEYGFNDDDDDGDDDGGED